MCSRSSNVSVLIKEGVFFYWKKSALFENKGAFLARNQCFRVFLNFDNERMYPLNTYMPPPPPPPPGVIQEAHIFTETDWQNK